MTSTIMLIAGLPPQARRDAQEDYLNGGKDDPDFHKAVVITDRVATANPGYDGDELYALVEKEIAREYQVPQWMLRLYGRVTGSF